ncbi:MAG TPA: cytochrome P450 [Amycolatopsis sp.]|uniref:cytochrome P450 n=1 Tax=Amycolatopsis sp. TaxID=37632 RepID=UPI002B48C14B|nr:cytochrome P450 [Amycolatopsis sp.]HJQ45737.1 cytochrome P450 [Amycolatopsis sp.]HKS46059.1 cytochrome P450 [Amycolatopsis sp.]
MTPTASDPVERLTVRFDHHDPEYTPDLAELVHSRIQERSPVAYSEAYGGMWLVSRYREVKAVLKDHETFSSAEGVFFPKATGTPKFAPVDYDRPEHTTFRALMTPPLDLEQMRGLSGSIAEITSELIKPLADRGQGDFANELAMPLTIRSVALAIGLSKAAQWKIRELTRNLWRHLPRDRDASRFWPQFAAMFTEEITRARKEPGDDHLSFLVRAEFDGRPITDDELHSMLVSYCMAGHETTMNAISHLLWHLARNQDLQQRLRADPGLVPAAAEEALRLWSPVGNHSRVTTREVVLGGVTIPRGARVLLLMGAANRDPEQFENPEEFRLDRKASPHLGFGFGIHYCIGAHLARLELTTTLRELARLPDYHLIEKPRRYIENGRHVVLEKLLVRFEK